MPNYDITIDKTFFNKAYLPYRICPIPLQIFFGGSSSGKSKFIAQRLVEDLLDGGRNFLVIRKVGATLRHSVFNEVKKVIREDWELTHLFKIHNSEMTITCVNGYQAFFKGLDDPEKVKSITPEIGVITDIWIEEATEISEDDFLQLKKRLRGLTDEDIQKRIVFSFNPIYKTHWIYNSFFAPIGWHNDQKKFSNTKLVILKTTFKDNKFLAKEDKKSLREEKNDYYYQVYSLGNWGILGDLIFTNWKAEDILNNKRLVETFDRYYHGLDFGYSNDPAAYNKMYYNPNLRTLYITKEWHKKGASNEAIALAIKEDVSGDQLTCDSAEPKSIAELNSLSIAAVGAKKGKDSVNYGIQWLKGINIVIDVSCQYTINEFGIYQWKKDKNGESINQPIDKNNHHIDAIRYAIEELILISKDIDDIVETVGTLDTALDTIDW